MAQPQQAASALDARAAMERLNAEAGKLHIWLRTQANAPAQPPWFRATGLEAQGSLAEGRVGAAQLKPLPHLWRWREISPYLDRIAEIARAAETPPTEFAERQQFLLTNPGLGGRLQVSATMRCAVSIYNPGDIAPVHIHTPNASRTILSRAGGYTVIEGERVEAERGDLILTPNGTWHDHGNDGENPVVWMDVLDFPLLEFLDCVWLDEAYPAASGGNARTQAVTRPRGYSQKLYGHGGIIPGFVAHRRGFGREVTPMFRYRGRDIRAALDGLREEASDPYEGITVAFVNPATGMPLFPTLGYSAQLLRAGEATRWKRETASTLYLVIAGRGHTEIGRRRFEWAENDIFVVPGFLWRRHVNSPDAEAVLYAVSDRPLLDKIGQYRAQGRLADGTVVELSS
jgi:gentisate 1,2-dioxygenase